MIGLVVALEDEFKGFLKNITKKNYHRSNFEFILAKYYDHEFVIVISDVGKVNAAFATSMLLQQFDKSIDLVLNIGSCGSCKKNIKPLDVLLIERTKYLDVDFTAFGYEKNAVPRRSKVFDLKQKNKELFNYLISNFKTNKSLISGFVGTSDTFIDETKYKKMVYDEHDQVDACDMELASIAQVCELFNKPLLSVKIISDEVIKDKTTKDNSQQFYENMKWINEWFERYLLDLIKVIDFKINQKKDN